MPGESGSTDQYFYDLNGDFEIDNNYDYYDNLALSIQTGQLPLNFSTFSCFLTKLSQADLTPELITPQIEPESSYEQHLEKTITVTAGSYQNTDKMVWNEENKRYIPRTSTVSSESKFFKFVQDFGADGCADVHEDGSDGCLPDLGLNSSFINNGEPFTDEENGIWDEGEVFYDYGIDRCEDEYEDGNGGCYDFKTLDCGDPNGDNYPDGLEGNGVYDLGEEFDDEKNGVWDEGEQFTDSNGNGEWDRGDPNQDGGSEEDGVLDFETSNYINCEDDDYNSESACVVPGYCAGNKDECWSFTDTSSCENYGTCAHPDYDEATGTPAELSDYDQFTTQVDCEANGACTDHLEFTTEEECIANGECV